MRSVQERPRRNFSASLCTKSTFDTTSLHLHGHLSVLRAGGPRHISMWDQKDLCDVSKAHTEGLCRQSDRAKSIVIATHIWHRESGRGLTGAGAFLAFVQPRQEGNNGLKRRPRPFRKTLLERL